MPEYSSEAQDPSNQGSNTRAQPQPWIQETYWKNSVTGVILLTSDWRDPQSLPPLFLGPDPRPFDTLEAAPLLEYGHMAGYFVHHGRVVFVVSSEQHQSIDLDKAEVYVNGTFNHWKGTGNEEWRLSPGRIDGQKVLVLRVPLRRLRKHEAALFKFQQGDGTWLEVSLGAPNRDTSDRNILNYRLDLQQTGRHVFRFTTPRGYSTRGNESVIWKSAEGEESHTLPPAEGFHQLGEDQPLGALVQGGTTTFRLFCPRAKSAEVFLYSKLDESDAKRLKMERKEGVFWEITVDKDLHGSYYHYQVDGNNLDASTQFDKRFKVLDPYARAAVSHRGPGIVYSEERLPKPKRQYQPPPWHDLVILEAHVRDLVAEAPIEKQPNELPGFAQLERWIKDECSYIRSLGVNAIELQPIQEFDNRTAEEYHWGYMPVNWFAPESSYGSVPEQGSQVEELASLVETCHEEGLSVILDVVYNHYGEPNHLLFLDKLYYFETDPYHNLMNWSGCGNDFKAHTKMGRKLIIDSLIHLIETYDVDGFRFDLAELLGAEVLIEIESRLKAVKPSIILIAEPWSFRGHIADQLRPTGWSSWNDGYRDYLAKYIRKKVDAQGLEYFLRGSPESFARFPAQSVNYVESHDDLCWLDKITENKDHNGYLPQLVDRRRTHLMAAVLLASIGVPMLAEGGDFLRSKHGVNNTYQRGDLNALNYDRLYTYPNTHAYFAAWIRFRLSEQGRFLRLSQQPEGSYFQSIFGDGNAAFALIYNADGSLGKGGLLFAINPEHEAVELKIGGWQARIDLQIADHERLSPTGLPEPHFPIRNEHLHLSPLSCGLWTLS